MQKRGVFLKITQLCPKEQGVLKYLDFIKIPRVKRICKEIVTVLNVSQYSGYFCITIATKFSQYSEID